MRFTIFISVAERIDKIVTRVEIIIVEKMENVTIYL